MKFKYNSLEFEGSLSELFLVLQIFRPHLEKEGLNYVYGPVGQAPFVGKRPASGPGSLTREAINAELDRAAKLDRTGKASRQKVPGRKRVPSKKKARR